MKKGCLVAVLLALAGACLGIFLSRTQTQTQSADPSQTEKREPLAASTRKPVPYDVAEVVYDGKLGEGWEDWGWGAHKLGPGPAEIEFANYGGIIFHHAPLESPFLALVFRYKAPPTWTEFLTVSLKGRGAPAASFPAIDVQPRDVAQLADGFREVLVNFSELNPANAVFDRVLLTARKSLPSEHVLIDHVLLTQGPALVANAAPERPTTLKLSCVAPDHRISTMIYGGSMAVWEAAQSGQRIGGNPLTRFNWDASAWNSGADWFFENVEVAGVQRWLSDAKNQGQPLALVVPMIGWVAKDATSVGFPRSKFPQQRKFDPNRSEAGDGYRPDGSALVPLAPAQTSVPAPPELVGRWIRGLRDAGPTGALGMYILDNEPALWDVNHRDVHPQPVGYDELLERTIAYGTEIRRADPNAVIAGPAEWGWSAYSDSAKDRDGPASKPDRKAHGDVPLIPWYLRQLADLEKTRGTRILDVLDVHFYPAAAGIYGPDAKLDAASAELRIRSTRALWDPTYQDESWIDQPVKLIPRLKEWVANNYPGRKISLGEWSFGADEHISGGLATAEALGRFGQQGLDAAYFWGGPKPGTPAFWAFRAFRNFDAKGARFQDFSLATWDGDNVSLFASRDPSWTEVVAILINRDSKFAMRARIELQGCRSVTSYRVFRYAAGFQRLEPAKGDGASDGAVTETLAPYSIEILELHLKP